MENRKLSMQAKARLQFADWLKENHPEIFRRAIGVAVDATDNAANRNASLRGLGEEETATPSFWERFSTAAIGIGSTYLSLKNEKEAMKITLARPQAGMPPINASTSEPVVRTQVDFSPELTTLESWIL